VDILLFNQTSLTGGRYRFSVSYVEYLLKNGLESPHKLFNQYIVDHVGRFPGDTGEPFASAENDLRIQVKMVGFNWGRLRLGRFVLQLPIPLFEIR
jgi:hypothetical protein